jgi:hypothetical protein
VRTLLSVLSMVIGLATVLAEARAADAAPSAPRVEKVTHADLWKQARSAERQRMQAAIAIFVTDDADSLRLPAFASRTTPLPTRFVRVGVEWSF